MTVQSPFGTIDGTTVDPPPRNTFGASVLEQPRADDKILFTIDKPARPPARDPEPRRAAARQRQEELARFRREQELQPVELSALLGRVLPTIAGAAAQVADAGGRLEEHAGRLVVLLPARLFPDGGLAERQMRRKLLDASVVLAEAQAVVLASLSSSSVKPIADRLPDRQVALGGALA